MKPALAINSKYNAYKCSMSYLNSFYPKKASEKIQHIVQRLAGCYLLQLGGSKPLDEIRDHPASYKWWIVHPKKIKSASKMHPSSYSLYEALPLPSEIIDILLIPYLLEYEQYPERLLQEAWRVLNKGGHLIILSAKSYAWWSCFANSSHPYNATQLIYWTQQQGGVIVHRESLSYQGYNAKNINSHRWLSWFSNRSDLIIIQKCKPTLVGIQVPLVLSMLKLLQEV